MKMVSIVLLLAVLGIGSSMAAPVESVDSARASAAHQKVDGFLNDAVVADQLHRLGVSPEQAHARLAQLDDAQVEQLAAQIDLLQAGGSIQCGHARPLGPLGCVIRSIHHTIHHIIAFLFCWDDIR